MRALLIFLDGVGLGSDGEYNPFTRAHMPVMTALLDGRTALAGNAPFHGTRASLLALDATLGKSGTPQSGTGQTTLLTGRNAVELHGRHFGPWVPAALRPMLREHSILARAVRAGKAVAFANAYPEQLMRMADDADRRLPAFLRAGPPVAAIGAGVFSRNARDLMNGNAVASEITNDGWREHLGHTDLPVITAETAGRTLSSIAAAQDLTLFAHYATDTIGHDGSMEQAVAALERVDEFLGGVTIALPADCVLFIASDHGNIEDVRVGHTRNPALGIVAGEDHASISAQGSSLLDVAPMIMKLLGVA